LNTHLTERNIRWLNLTDPSTAEEAVSKRSESSRNSHGMVTAAHFWPLMANGILQMSEPQNTEIEPIRSCWAEEAKLGNKFMDSEANGLLGGEKGGGKGNALETMHDAGISAGHSNSPILLGKLTMMPGKRTIAQMKRGCCFLSKGSSRHSLMQGGKGPAIGHHWPAFGQ
jgi:hypothetical protein